MLSTADQNFSARLSVPYAVLLRQARLAVQGRLLRDLVHEISNSLQAALGALVLTMEDLPSPRSEELDIAYRELLRLERLLVSVRKLYQAPAEGQPPDVRRTLEEVFLLLRKALQKRQVRWGLHGEAGPLTVRGDCVALHLIFLGLMLYWLGPEEGAGPKGLDVVARREGEWMEVVFTLKGGPRRALSGEVLRTGGTELWLGRELLTACGGTLTVEPREEGEQWVVRLPVEEKAS